MTELVKTVIKDHIADVRLNRPGKYNALNHEMFHALAGTIKRLEQARSVRVIVVSGEGKGFCAGLDRNRFEAAAGGEPAPGNDLTERYEDRAANLVQFVSIGWKQLPVPVIAAVHGAAFGAGCQLALGADIRLAAPDARFSLMEIQWGLIPDMGITRTLRGLVAEDTARELMYTGKVISGQEAAQVNLVTRTCDNPREEALVLAADIASRNPHAVRAAKSLVNRTWHSADLDAALLLESQFQMSLKGTPNQLEAIRANLEGRTADFRDP